MISLVPQVPFETSTGRTHMVTLINADTALVECAGPYGQSFRKQTLQQRVVKCHGCRLEFEVEVDENMRRVLDEWEIDPANPLNLGALSYRGPLPEAF